MKSGGTAASSPGDDTSLPQFRDIHPQLPSLRIAPLRPPAPSRILKAPLPLEPTASAVHDKTKIPPTSSTTTTTTTTTTAVSGGTTLPAKLPTLEEFLNAARTTHSVVGSSVDSVSSLEPPPKTILPAFVNLRALEKLPYSSFEENAPHKRRRLDVSGDHFSGEPLQLPVPHAQSEKKPPPPFGPFAILNGLNEPPPNAALFPPIEPGSLPPILTRPTKDVSVGGPDAIQSDRHSAKESVDKREGRLEEILDSKSQEKAGQASEVATAAGDDKKGHTGGKDGTAGTSETSQKPVEDSDEPMSPKTRGRSRKKLRKWTEQETHDLLRGVVKCGIGNWTAILAQPELKFNKRTAANLKDRFRVCCPWAYGAADPNEATRQIQTTLANALMNAESRDSGAGGKILLPDPRPNKPGAESGSTASDAAEPSSGSDATGSQTRSTKSLSSLKTAPTLSNKSKSTLVSLGIPEPYFTIKSKRRSRRPFTPAEDEALLKGYAVHGFQWTMIQQDKHLNLSHRRATDLRDRFRTKFPHAYREGGSVSGKTIGTQLNTPADRNRNLGSGSLQANEHLLKHPILPDPKINTPTKKNSHDIPTAAAAATTTLGPGPGPGPIDATMLPPAPAPQPPPPPPPPAPGLLDMSSGPGSSSGGVFPFSLEESTTATTTAGNSSSSSSLSSSSWEDNTLPPLVWDELG
ncbi:MYB DNA-binding domain protein [Rasamsonia emersonii CBS 393.64]|uniref:MYB DNA-binding domain protein n=1 Tax=Rasamsonia emersonii (strain ATCC 16479 / CBS 393.64 / IMI 116815) TaxID=1408163 RepID=A0A0F4Z6G6_RASE3|nr:MYB DNA-binding domain protein [Rasamsonia emersonii CBS 393.64]KKA25930.1 MYB DNA-binding domain protein [Rasamsonia emersonii CBS 393.64]